MVSAAFASQNESSWPQSGGGYMNPNPKKKQKQFHSSVNVKGNGDGRYESTVVTQSASDDGYSFNQRTNGVDSSNGFNFGGYKTIRVESLDKIEANELRKRLVLELDRIRSIRDRINSGQFSSTNKSQNPRGKGSKKIAPFGSNNKDLNKLSNGVEDKSDFSGMMKECRMILNKVMKHKDGWVFNVPVDDVALGLHDYHQIVKRPMDLGTVKGNLSKKMYLSPVEFAGDVRLTFKNALLYNPKHDPVHGMAEGLLARFEELFKPIQHKIDELRGEFHRVDDVQGGSNLERIKKSILSPVVQPAPRMTSMKKLEKVQARSPSSASTPSYPPPPSVDNPPSMPIQPPLQTTGKVAKTKLPKPRAKDPNKREMSLEEKHKLGVGLQNLPQEKMPQLVQIIRKRDEHLAQDGDEIELDIEALDTETLWELDRFVTNWKKAVSKTNRQALLMNMNLGNAATDTDVGAAMSENNDSGKKPNEVDDLDEDNVDIEDDMKKPDKGGDFDEDNVDIEDDTPVTSYPPVEIEKDAGGVVPEGNGNVGSDSSSSSSSGSDSSSSSDTGSGSSSGSDSDEDEAQS